MHHCFEKYVERFHPHWNCLKLLVEKLFRATTSHTAKNLWPAHADGDTELAKSNEISDFIYKKNT